MKDMRWAENCLKSGLDQDVRCGDKCLYYNKRDSLENRRLYLSFRNTDYKNKGNIDVCQGVKGFWGPKFSISSICLCTYNKYRHSLVINSFSLKKVHLFGKIKFLFFIAGHERICKYLLKCKSMYYR